MYPKDGYLLSRIDTLVDLTIEFLMMSFFGAFLRHHQIMFHLIDCEKMNFIIDEGLFYYKILSFRLKNIGSIS